MHKQHLLFLAILLLFSGALSAQNNEVHISPKGGVYADAFPVTLTCSNATLQIRYTLNGATPDMNSALYSVPLMLSNSLKSRSDIYKIHISPEDEFYLPDSVVKAIVIRAATFDNAGNRIGPTVTQSYFVASLGCEIHPLPVVSICTDSLSLFAHDTGILVPGDLYDPADIDRPGNYSQHGREWERTVNVEYYDTGNNGFNQTAGLRTHGGNLSRRAQQKGLKIYARKEYGKKDFPFKIFEERETNKFKRLILRPFNNACSPAGIQDWLANHIAAPLNMGTTASKPVTLFLNGEYWGIYFLEEKADERYIESHYDIDHDNVNVIDNWAEPEAGSSDEFYALYYELVNADLSDSVQYDDFSKKIDIPNIIDYYLFELFSANRDWPINNVRCWQVPGGPWHWIFYDGDWCLTHTDFDVYGNATFTGVMSWPTSEWSTLFFRKLIENETFKKQFLERLEELNSTYFDYRATKPYLSQIQQRLHDEIPRQSQRFNNPKDTSEWNEHCDYIDYFLARREVQFRVQTLDFFHLNDYSITHLAFFPNPARAGESLNFMVESESDNIESITLYDMNGKIVLVQHFFLQKGENIIPLETGDLKGVYIAKMGKGTCKVILL